MAASTSAMDEKVIKSSLSDLLLAGSLITTSVNFSHCLVLKLSSIVSKLKPPTEFVE